MAPVEPSTETPASSLPTAHAGRYAGRYRDGAVLCLAFGAAASIVLSIAVSQILLGIGLLALFAFRVPLRFPPIKMPLFLFFAATVAADLLSGDPWRGIPPIRKFFVFGIVLLVFSAFRSVEHVRTLVLVWAACGIVSGGVALEQFVKRWRQAVELHASFYDYLLDGRVTGLAGHWMTFGGEQMIVLVMLISFLLFAEKSKWKSFGWVCAGIIWMAIVLGLTRSIFLFGVPVGILYLVWNFRRRIVWAIPALGVALLLAAPGHVRERIVSVVHPHGEVDSNSRRIIMLRAGWEMIRKHPWFGVGTEQVGPRFLDYVPSDVARPLPKGWYGHLHNIYVQFAAERGVPALVFILWMIGKMGVDLRRPLRRHSVDVQARFILHGALAVMLAVLAEGFFEHNLGDSEVLTMFLVSVTCGYVAIDAARKEPTCA